MKQINFDNIKEGNIISSNVLFKHVKIIKKINNAIYFCIKHPISKATMLCWYKKEQNNIIFNCTSINNYDISFIVENITSLKDGSCYWLKNKKYQHYI